MSTRHMIAAAALMATTFAAQAEVIALAGASTADTPVVDGAASPNGDSLADMLAPSNGSARLYLVRGVEGLYLLASRTIDEAAEAEGDILPVPVPGDVALDVLPDTPVPVGTIPTANPEADPVVNAADVPEPGSLALLLAGVLGAVGLTRGRKQG